MAKIFSARRPLRTDNIGMSCNPGLLVPVVSTAAGDAGRVCPLQESEYVKLVEAMKVKLMPLLEETGALLKNTGFSIAKTEFFGQMASLMVADIVGPKGSARGENFSHV